MIRKIVIGVLAILVVIQFFRPAKNIVTEASTNDIATLYGVPADVEPILKKACFDCHSNNTRYPWYFNFQPVAWWMTDHINEAKEELNFSEFGNLPLPRQLKKIQKTAKAVKDGWMPLNSYTWIHKDAILTDAEKDAIVAWTQNVAKQIESKGK